MSVLFLYFRLHITAPMKTVIKNISELIQVEETTRKWVAGSEMAQLQTIQDGFVEMEDGADAAIEALNGFELKGRALRVNEAQSKERSGGGGGGRRY